MPGQIYATGRDGRHVLARLPDGLFAVVDTKAESEATAFAQVERFCDDPVLAAHVEKFCDDRVLAAASPDLRWYNVGGGDRFVRLFGGRASL